MGKHPLQEFLVKGFTMDDELQPRRVYLRVREMFAIAADYTQSAKETLQFFKTIQNKLHVALSTNTSQPE